METPICMESISFFIQIVYKINIKGLLRWVIYGCIHSALNVRTAQEACCITALAVLPKVVLSMNV